MGVYDFDLESIYWSRPTSWHRHRAGRGESGFRGFRKSMAETLSAFFKHVGWRGDSGARGASGVLRCSGLQGACCGRRACPDVRRKMEPPVRASVEIVEFEGSPVVGGHGARTAARLKPCFVKSRAMHDGSYVRVGDGDRRLSPYRWTACWRGRRPPRYDRESGRRGCDGRL